LLQVTNNLIKPAVKVKACRYVDLIPASASAASSTGGAFYFVSHGWGRPFIELVDQCKEHFSPEQQAIWQGGKPFLPWSQVWSDIVFPWSLVRCSEEGS
jgi:hypothetical protein